MFQKGGPSATSFTAPKESLIITQLKFPNGIQYKRATQRCCHEILLPGQQKKYGCIIVLLKFEGYVVKTPPERERASEMSSGYSVRKDPQ